MDVLATNIKYYRKLHKMTQKDLANALDVQPTAVSAWEIGRNKPLMDKIEQMSILFNIKKSELLGEQSAFIIKHTTTSSNSQLLVDTYNKLHEPRQEKVLKYAKQQLKEQTSQKVISIAKEDNTTYHSTKKFPVQVTEALAAGVGHSYDENNEQYTVYTDRDNLKNYNLASFISGDSMEPKYKNGDVALIQKGYDNIQGAVYAIDYNGKTFMKKLYNDGHQFRLVSINDKYDDILIDVPVDEDIYFNIVGRVVDSFTPLES